MVATRQAVTIFNKKGVEVETDRNGDIRQNTIWSRKYYLAALTDATKAVKIFKGYCYCHCGQYGFRGQGLLR